MTRDVVQASAERERGNALYKDGKIVEGKYRPHIQSRTVADTQLAALNAYMKACTIDPQDAAAAGNLSAANFEMGLYDCTIKDIHRALELSTTGEGPRINRLNARLARTYLFQKAYDNAAQVRISFRVGKSETNFRREKLLRELPRYKPPLTDASIFYVAGHDEAQPIADDTLLQEPSDEILDFLFGGIGDARHLFATWIYLYTAEQRLKQPRGRKYRFTTLQAGHLVRHHYRFQRQLPSTSGKDQHYTFHPRIVYSDGNVEYSASIRLAIPKLPKLRSVYTYEITFEKGVDDIDLEGRTNNEFVLVLVDGALLSKVKRKDLREVLLNNEIGNRARAAQEVRESGIMVTTFAWMPSTNTARFQMREVVIDRLRGQHTKPWLIGILYTINWRIVPCTFQPAASSVRKLSAWAE
ncbi:hypothetical protein NA57DRAFT_75247 [Rhizodiscina lignyota]|uniref:Uncharacterized protein n=1 Tax=Rhizodiscina lignyota TaxID=1504668 RepID=A0A9P4II56_9PEZI|nr:hypothetical protein NA57DRAFT_75247 [Rhizodiscina lignyota]